MGLLLPVILSYKNVVAIHPFGGYDALSDEQKNSGAFAKGDTLKSPIGRRQAAAAFRILIYNFMNSHTIDACRRTIDGYARNDGTAWGEMRMARNLDRAGPPTPWIGREL